MPSANVTVTTNAAFIPELWSDLAVKAVETKLIMSNLINRDYDELAVKGDTINISTVSNFTTAAKVEDTAITYQANTETDIALVISNHYATGIRVEDIAKIQSLPGLLQAQIDKLSYPIAKQIETSIFTAIVPSASAPDHQLTWTTASTATASEILAAKALLDAADVPMENRYLVLRPAVYNSLLKVADFVRADYMGEANVRNGMVGMIYGMEVYMSNAQSTYDYMFHKDAVTMAMQQDINIKSQYDIDYLADSVVASAIWGVKQLRDEFAVRFTNA